MTAADRSKGAGQRRQGRERSRILLFRSATDRRASSQAAGGDESRQADTGGSTGIRQ